MVDPAAAVQMSMRLEPKNSALTPNQQEMGEDLKTTHAKPPEPKRNVKRQKIEADDSKLTPLENNNYFVVGSSRVLSVLSTESDGKAALIVKHRDRQGNKYVSKQLVIQVGSEGGDTFIHKDPYPSKFEGSFSLSIGFKGKARVRMLALLNKIQDSMPNRKLQFADTGFLSIRVWFNRSSTLALHRTGVQTDAVDIDGCGDRRNCNWRGRGLTGWLLLQNIKSDVNEAGEPVAYMNWLLTNAVIMQNIIPIPSFRAEYRLGIGAKKDTVSAIKAWIKSAKKDEEEEEDDTGTEAVSTASAPVPFITPSLPETGQEEDEEDDVDEETSERTENAKEPTPLV